MKYLQNILLGLPYTDYSTGQMIVTIAAPFFMDGGQAVILADITIDRLIEMVRSAGANETVQAFLLAADNSVITHENAEFLPKEEGNNKEGTNTPPEQQEQNVSPSPEQQMV